MPAREEATRRLPQALGLVRYPLGVFSAARRHASQHTLPGGLRICVAAAMAKSAFQNLIWAVQTRGTYSLSRGIGANLVCTVLASLIGH